VCTASKSSCRIWITSISVGHVDTSPSDWCLAASRATPREERNVRSVWGQERGLYALEIGFFRTILDDLGSAVGPPTRIALWLETRMDTGFARAQLERYRQKCRQIAVLAGLRFFSDCLEARGRRLRSADSVRHMEVGHASFSAGYARPFESAHVRSSAPSRSAMTGTGGVLAACGFAGPVAILTFVGKDSTASKRALRTIHRRFQPHCPAMSGNVHGLPEAFWQGGAG
jgi:hypothetical protein